jgi:hypothetical protein
VGGKEKKVKALALVSLISTVALALVIAYTVLRMRACSRYYENLKGRLEEIDQREQEWARGRSFSLRQTSWERRNLLWRRFRKTSLEQLLKFWRRPETFYDLETILYSPLDYIEKDS